MGELFALVRNSIRRLFGRPRFYVALMVTACSLILIFRDAPGFLRENALCIQVFEPFIMTISNRLPQLLLVLSFLLLLGDAPFFHEGIEIVFVRTNKRRWLAAQMLTVGAVTLLWLIFIVLFLMLFFVPRISFANEWSVYTKTAARLWYGSNVVGLSGVDVAMQLLLSGSPYVLFAVSLFYCFLLFFYCGMWAIVLNLLTKRSYGSVLVVSFCALRFALYNLFFVPALEMISPMNLIDLNSRSLTLQNFIYTVLFFTLQSLLLWFLANRALRKRDIVHLR